MMPNEPMSSLAPRKVMLRLNTDIETIAARIGTDVTGVPAETLSTGFVVKVEIMKMYMDVPCEVEQAAGLPCDVLVPGNQAGIYTDRLVEAIKEKLVLASREILWEASSSEEAQVAIAKLRGDLPSQQSPADQGPRLI